MDIEEEEEESVEKMEQTRLRELRKMFASSLKNCFEPCAIDEFAQLFPGLPMDYHVPLYDLYAQLLREVSEKSKDEFEQIVEEERIESRLNAIDDACKQRGIDQMKSVEVIAREIIGEQVIPEDAARAARVDAKRRELVLLAKEAEEIGRIGEAEFRMLEEKRIEVSQAAMVTTRAQNELEGVRDASLQWAGRQAYVSR